MAVDSGAGAEFLRVQEQGSTVHLSVGFSDGHLVVKDGAGTTLATVRTTLTAGTCVALRSQVWITHALVRHAGAIVVKG
jgi:hypothetical protein